MREDLEVGGRAMSKVIFLGKEVRLGAESGMIGGWWGKGEVKRRLAL